MPSVSFQRIIDCSVSERSKRVEFPSGGGAVGRISMASWSMQMM